MPKSIYNKLYPLLFLLSTECVKWVCKIVYARNPLKTAVFITGTPRSVYGPAFGFVRFMRIPFYATFR